jgi:hypothetical protein
MKDRLPLFAAKTYRRLALFGRRVALATRTRRLIARVRVNPAARTHPSVTRLEAFGFEPAAVAEIRGRLARFGDVLVARIDQDGRFLSEFGPIKGASVIGADGFTERKRFTLDVMALKDEVIAVRKNFRGDRMAFLLELDALNELGTSGLNVPALLGVDARGPSIIMTFLAGRVLREAMALRGAVVRDCDLAGDARFAGLTSDEQDLLCIEEGRRVLPEVVEPGFVEQLFELLLEIHARGILVQDIKFGNVIIGPDGKPWLFDFENAARYPWAPDILFRSLRDEEIETFNFHYGTSKTTRARARRLLPSVIIAALLSFAGAARSAGVAARDPKAVKEVLKGVRKTANAAWWGFNPVNATAALQAAIRSGASAVIVPNVGSPWIVDPIFLESNQEITFEPGVEVQARRGGFRGASDELFRLEDKENVVIKGYGSVLRMRKEDYRRPPYEKAEWRTCLAIYGGTNVKILGITCASTGGDGIYITGGSRPYSKDIVIKDFISENGYRQGISVISVEGLLIEGAVLRGTEGTEPAAGIDFEPNLPTERLAAIRMKNCVIEKNAGYGIQVGLGRMPAAFHRVQIDIEGGRVSGNGDGAILIHSGKVEGGVSIQDVKLDGKRSFKVSKAFAVKLGGSL